MKSLRSTGMEQAARACCRYSVAPWKNCWSVSTDRHAAPLAASLAAISAGRKSARRTPFDGDAFFTSVMTPAWPAAILARMLASKPRRSARNSALASTSSRRLAKPRCFFAAATSSALTARILLRMSDMMAPDKRVSKSSGLLCEREPQAERQEQAAGDAVQPQRHAWLELEPLAGEGGEHGQRITPQHAVEIEEAAEDHEGQWFAVRVG